MKIPNKNNNWGDTIASIQEKRVYDAYTYTYISEIYTFKRLIEASLERHCNASCCNVSTYLSPSMHLINS